MSKTEKYKHGTPCWVDLATTDPAGAKAFYAGLFGWEYQDEEMGEMGIGVYSMATLEGSAAAANGGAVLADSRDVGHAGRVAVIADPTGCVTTLWEPGEFKGCGVTSKAGAYTWSEHLSTDR